MSARKPAGADIPTKAKRPPQTPPQKPSPEPESANDKSTTPSAQFSEEALLDQSEDGPDVDMADERLLEDDDAFSHHSISSSESVPTRKRHISNLEVKTSFLVFNCQGRVLTITHSRDKVQTA